MLQNEESSPGHLACFRGNTRMLEVVMRLTTEDTWYKLLQIPDSHEGYTPLHMSAFSVQTQAIKPVADSLIPERLAYILKITDNNGYTPLQLAKYRGRQAAAELLQYYQTKALIDVALQQTDETGTNTRLSFQYKYISRLQVRYL